MQRLAQKIDRSSKKNGNSVVTEEEFEEMQIVDKKWLGEIVHETIKKRIIWDHIQKNSKLGKLIKVTVIRYYCLETK